MDCCSGPSSVPGRSPHSSPVCFCVSLLGFGFLPFIFFPDSQRNLLTLNLSLPLGTRIETTTARVQKIEGYIADSLLVSPQRLRGGDRLRPPSSARGLPPTIWGYQPGEGNPSSAHLLLNTSFGRGQPVDHRPPGRLLLPHLSRCRGKGFQAVRGRRRREATWPCASPGRIPTDCSPSPGASSDSSTRWRERRTSATTGGGRSRRSSSTSTRPGPGRRA